MTEIRHVLLCNDDGVFFPGIRALADAFLGAGWRVTVCAPDRERSAASHSMVLKDPIVAQRVKWDAEHGPTRLDVWQTSGAPSDCVRLALFELMDAPPDIVVSGINNGLECRNGLSLQRHCRRGDGGYFSKHPGNCRFGETPGRCAQCVCRPVCAARCKARARNGESSSSALEH